MRKAWLAGVAVFVCAGWMFEAWDVSDARETADLGGGGLWLGFAPDGCLKLGTFVVLGARGGPDGVGLSKR